MVSEGSVNSHSNFPFERISLQAGFVVLKKGDRTDEMLYVEEGELEAFDDEKILYSIPQGSLIGVAAVMDGTSFSESIRTGKGATVIKIDKKAMESVLKRSPAWMLALVSSLSSEYRQLKKSADKPIYANSLESFTLFLAKRTGREPLDTAQVLREYRWQTRATKEETVSALKELLRRKFARLEPDDSGKPNARLLTVKPKLLNILFEYLHSSRNGKTYPPFGLSSRERFCLEALSLEDSLFTRTRKEWLEYLTRKVSRADFIIVIKFVELGIFSKVPDTDKLFLETDILDKFLCAVHGERNIKGLL